MALIPAFFLLIVLWVTLFSIWKEPIPSMMGMLTLFVGWAIWWGRKESSPLSLTSSTHGFFDIQQVSGIFFSQACPVGQW